MNTMTVYEYMQENVHPSLHYIFEAMVLDNIHPMFAGVRRTTHLQMFPHDLDMMLEHCQNDTYQEGGC